MTPKEINILLSVRGLKTKTIAHEINEPPETVSYILTYARTSGAAVRRVRLKVAAHLGLPVEELFDDAEPATADELESYRSFNYYAAALLAA